MSIIELILIVLVACVSLIFIIPLLIGFTIAFITILELLRIIIMSPIYMVAEIITELLKMLRGGRR